MKHTIVESIKAIALNSIGAILTFFTIAGKAIRGSSPYVIRAIRFTYTLLLHPVVVIAYSWYLKGGLTLQKRGISIRHPLLSLLSREQTSFGVLIVVGIFVVSHNLLFLSSDADAFLIPQNIVSRMVGGIDEISVETESASSTQEQGYLQDIGVRSDLGMTEEGEEAKQSPDAGSIASLPGTLIKPVIPSIQDRPYKATTIQTYSVKNGDTLGGIARSFNIKLTTLLWSNDLTERSFIHEGQHLVILPVDGLQYRVKRGDTLAQIANTYQSDVAKIMGANRLNNANDIAIGELLIIPGGVLTSPVRRQQAPSQPTLLARLRNAIIPPGAPATRGAGFIWPTSARRITQYFSWRHTGVDIAGPTSNRIYAAQDGIVSFAGWASGYGLSIVITHPSGIKTRYGHSRQLFVKTGDAVTKGQTIAMVGSTGRSTGPHLHFEVLVGGRRVNPFAYIR